MEGMTKEQREAYRDEHMWEWMEENDKARKQVQADITEFSRSLHENLRNRKAVQERLAFSLSRFSPASAYQLTCMNLAGTDIRLKDRYETEMEQYQKTFVDYTEKKQQESGGATGGIRIEFNSDTGMKFSLGNRGGALDTSDMPRFQETKGSFSQIFASTIIDFGLLIFYIVIALVGAFVGFLRYDVR
jgi:hypothetical protein